MPPHPIATAAATTISARNSRPDRGADERNGNIDKAINGVLMTSF
jgi:hypothetical protein